MVAPNSRNDDSFGIFDAKTHFCELIERVERGEVISVTKHGHEVAKIVPSIQHDPAKARAAIKRLREIRKGVTLGGLTIRELINEGRK